MYFEIDENNIEQWEKPQIKESKRAFFYATITEGGDKEKLECFVDFCEDAIFEMQHAESLMSSGDNGVTKAVSEGPVLPDEDRPRLDKFITRAELQEPLWENEMSPDDDISVLLHGSEEIYVQVFFLSKNEMPLNVTKCHRLWHFVIA